MKAKPQYTCPRCGYSTVQRSHITAHMFQKAKPCPQLHDIELTEEVKQFVLKNRIYTQPQKNKHHKKPLTPIFNCPEIENIYDKGDLEAYGKQSCIYCINLGKDEKGNYLFKYGMSENIANRMLSHKTNFPHCKIVLVVGLGNISPRDAENNIRIDSVISQKAAAIQTKKELMRECFVCEPNEYKDLIAHIENKCKNQFIESKPHQILNLIKELSHSDRELLASLLIPSVIT